MSSIIQNNNYSCSSWNYGAYSSCNPCYIQHKYTNNYIPPKTSNLYNRYGKRPLREEERIVTNEYLKSINYMKKMEKNKDIFRTKSASGLRTTHRKSNNEDSNNQNMNEQNNNNVNTKTDITNYKFRLTYDEWLEVKNKQRMIFNQIKKIKEQEDEKMEKVNMKVDKKYKEIKNKKYQEWLDNKNKEFRRKKQMKLEEELKKEEEKKRKDEEREERMNLWFKQQAEKMEREILEQQEELKIKKEKEKYDEEERKRKKKESKLKFKEWKEQKDRELKDKKEKMRIENETKSKSKHSNINKLNNKGFPIGPYTDAGALKEIQRFVAEKCTEDDEEEGIVNDNEMEGEEGVQGMIGQMTPEQIEQMKLYQMNQYMVDEQNQEKDNKNEINFNQQKGEDEEESKNDNNISI
jgi:hypothetical protein